MRQSLTRIYQRLPHWIANELASFYGARMDRLRYGEETEILVAQALERDYWSPKQWQDYQTAETEELLRFARRCPGYANAPANWQDWPILEKEQLRRNPQRYLVPDWPKRDLVVEHTSGSTGTPLTLFRPKEAFRRWYALFEARIRLWHGVNRQVRWANVGGKAIVDPGRSRPPFWVWNRASHQLVLSSYHLAPAHLPAYLQALQHYDIQVLWGYPSSIHALALAQKRIRQTHSLRVILTNAEPLYQHQRRDMEEAFRVPVRETYGLTEIVAGASECEQGSLHQWPDVGLTETLAEGDLSGEMLCTGFLNHAQPLVRYRCGDALSLESGTCSCGRTLPLLARIEGRCDDAILTADGRSIGRLDTLIKDRFPIMEAQFIQERVGALLFRYVPDEHFSDADRDRLLKHFAQYLQGMTLELEPVSSLERGANGKVKGVINRVNRPIS